MWEKEGGIRRKGMVEGMGYEKEGDGRRNFSFLPFPVSFFRTCEPRIFSLLVSESSFSSSFSDSSGIGSSIMLNLKYDLI